MSIPPFGPLAYTGTVAVPYISRKFAPTTSNNDFDVPTLWIDSDSGSAWILVAKPLGVANWLQVAGGTIVVETINGDSGSAVPSSGIINIYGNTSPATTGLTFTGSVNTLSLSGTLVVSHGGTGAATLTGLVTGNGTSAMTASPITQYNALVGGASNAVTSIAPSATSGVPFVSQGSSSNPTFGTAVVAGGGTGITAAGAAYAPICAGTTTTGAFQTASTGISTVDYVLTSTGSSSLPSFQPIGIKLLQNVQPSGGTATLTFQNYSTYLVIFDALFPATNGDPIYAKVSVDGGSTYIGTYFSGLNWSAYNSATLANVNSGTQIILGHEVHANGGGTGLSGYFYLSQPQSGPCIIGQTTYYNTAGPTYVQASIVSSTGSSVGTPTNIQITAPTTGLITFGEVSVYGLIKYQ